MGGWRTRWGLPLAESARGSLQDLLSKLTWPCHATSHLRGQKAEGSPCLLLMQSQALGSRSKGAALSPTFQFSFSQKLPRLSTTEKNLPCPAHVLRAGVYVCVCVFE